METDSSPPPPAPEGPRASFEPTPPDKKSKDWVLYTHLSGLCMLVSVPGIVGPLVCWLIKKDELPAVDAVGKDAINFHLTMLIGFLISSVLTIVVVGIIGVIAIPIISIICSIMGAIAASNGQPYAYPMTYRFLK
ncbi:DUF4870 domain-containing protein [Verrucomicrobiales bacterium]|nr:DUF4870 domain-containing protein [Verrucomicrobiales bacterium]